MLVLDLLLVLMHCILNLLLVLGTLNLHANVGLVPAVLDSWNLLLLDMLHIRSCGLRDELVVSWSQATVARQVVLRRHEHLVDSGNICVLTVRCLGLKDTLILGQELFSIVTLRREDIVLLRNHRKVDLVHGLGNILRLQPSRVPF